jgi:hypothetical protein
MHFQQDELKSDHYYWKEEDKSKFQGSPARRLFDPSNGEQVLFLINSYADGTHNFTKEEGSQIEQMICHDLPLQPKSEISVLHWINENISNALIVTHRKSEDHQTAQ